MSESEYDDPEMRAFATKRSRRLRIVAWVALISMLVAGGGATLVSLFVG